MRALLERLLPPPAVRFLRGWYRRILLTLSRWRNRHRSVQQVFTRVYANKEWGGDDGEDYCSGSGSGEAYAAAYAAVIRRLIAAKGIRRIVDLGCGDFRVGARLQMPGVSYVGVDIVEALIRRNRERFGGEGVSFQCLDMTTDLLPDGELCLMRQVLQHLSNAQIAAVLRQAEKYRYLVVTEHYPAPSMVTAPNLDKPHGPDTRVYDGSGVYLDRPPFGLKISRTLGEIEVSDCLVAEGELLRTFLIENRPGLASEPTLAHGAGAAHQ